MSRQIPTRAPRMTTIATPTDAPEPLTARPSAPTVGALALGFTDRPGVALRHHAGNGWRDVSYTELADRARAVARGLIALGIKPGDRVAVLANTRAEWTLLDLGGHCAGAVVVPVYHTNAPVEVRHVLAHSGSRVVFCEDEAQAAKVREVRDELPDLEHVVTLDGSEGMSLDELCARGEEVADDAVEQAVAAVSPQDPATIIYTSGTTGLPKGCITTHGNVMQTVAMIKQVLDVGPGHVMFMFLPLAHSLARVIQFYTLDVGATLGYWRGSTQTLLEDVAALRPTHLPSVPRIFEKIHTRALAQVEDGGALKKRIFDWAVAVGARVRATERAGGRVSPALRLKHALAEKLALRKVQALFGGRLELAVTGAAPIAPEVLEFFDACGILVLEGYGLTESTAPATFNTPAAFKFGTVGRPLPGVHARIAEDGEILLRGPNVFAGYYKNPEATRETLSEDGWLHTGDLGEIDSEGFLRVTGRKKEILITSSGKNIAPAPIESALRECRWISQAVLYADNRPYVTAVLTLDPDEVEALAEHVGVEPDIKKMVDDERVRAEIQRYVDEVNGTLARIEQIKKFKILERDFSQEAGEMTPTQKIKRAVVFERYREVFDALYES